MRWMRGLRSAEKFFEMNPLPPGASTRNLISAALSTVTILACCVLFSPGLGVMAMLGALTPYWETGRPLFARIRNGLLISTALTSFMALGVLVAPARWAMLPFTVLVILVAGMLYAAFMLTAGPSPAMLFYAAVIGSYFGVHASVGWSMVGVTAIAAILSSALVLLPLAVRPNEPELRAVAAARTSLTELEQQATEGPIPRAQRNAAFAATSAAWLTLRSAWPAGRSAAHRRLTAEVSRIDTRIAGIVLSRTDGDDASGDPPAEALPYGRPRWQFLMGRACHHNSLEWFTTWRMAAAATLAGLLSLAFGVGHPYWAIMTATIIINQWMSRYAATRRAAHRAIGTLIGLGVVWGVSAFDPSPWWSVAIVVLCMTGMYVTFPMNYALALIFVTPMTLVAVQSTGIGNLQESMSDRLLDTLIGVSVAVLVAWLTSRLFPRRLVRAQSARTQAATASLERHLSANTTRTTEGMRAQVELRYELTHHQNILERAVADDPRLADEAREEHAVADRGYRAAAAALVS